MIRSRIGANLRKIREAQGLSLRDLEQKSGIAFAHLQKIEVGKYDVRIDTLQTVCEALGVTISFRNTLLVQIEQAIEEYNADSRRHLEISNFRTTDEEITLTIQVGKREVSYHNISITAEGWCITRQSSSDGEDIVEDVMSIIIDLIAKK